jgi:hypothetical protein
MPEDRQERYQAYVNGKYQHQNMKSEDDVTDFIVALNPGEQEKCRITKQVYYARWGEWFKDESYGLNGWKDALSIEV